ncbi:1-phosphofructokinase family hexose kinase [Cellulosimicrobium cellulans]|uniref:1-phosphofructokinase family hexose kinase n=1 Tax=Cellulosimicrobium cellulans TaxID=1710 RepID=UPI0020968BFF|nr:PfkB family carbohydrate kinase [Cellulosimicrobium cellulans]MCO7275014.1 PfkB family carbohydrate kinase [Cellulosimicrobium cellulans]
MISALALSPSLDVTYVVDALEGIQRPREVRRVGGGKALNAVRAAASLGARTTAVAVLAGGSGEDVAAGARADGVDLRVVPGEHPTRTCVSVLAAETGALTEIYERAVPVGPDTLDRAVGLALDLATHHGGWWLLSGGLPGTIAPSVVGAVVGRLRAAGARVAVDSHGPALAGAVGEGPDLVKVNRVEAAELLGVPEDTPGPALVTGIRDRSGGLVVVTDGAEGAWASDGTSVLRVRLGGHVGRFPVGSGDSFLGGMLVALDTGASLAAAVALGAAAGTANAQVPGAAVLDADLARRLVGEVEVETVALPVP